jgi:regulator of telomere elongation helicase 1
MSIGAISEVTPGGVLIFFPSYRVMERCNEIWDQSNIKSHIEKIKKVFMEPKDPTKYQSTMDKYYKAIFKPAKGK